MSIIKKEANSYGLKTTTFKVASSRLEDLIYIAEREAFLAGIYWLSRQITDKFCGDESACDVMNFLEELNNRTLEK